MRKFETLTELTDVIIKHNAALENIPSEYLNEAGKAAIEAYRAILWHIGFHDTIESLDNDDDFLDLNKVEGKHPEYYKIISKVYRAIECSIQ